MQRQKMIGHPVLASSCWMDVHAETGDDRTSSPGIGGHSLSTASVFAGLADNASFGARPQALWEAVGGPQRLPQIIPRQRLQRAHRQQSDGCRALQRLALHTGWVQCGPVFDLLRVLN